MLLIASQRKKVLASLVLTQVMEAQMEHLFILGLNQLGLLVKQTDVSRTWILYDNKRSNVNVVNDALQPDLSDAEIVNNANLAVDFLSNGFKFRGASASSNANGGSYIYMAFAENPFVGSDGTPTTAR
jgi:hypothetical protein